MLNAKKIVVTGLLVAAGVALMVSQGAWSNAEAKSAKLEGNWMITVPGTPVLASLTLIPGDSSGRHASLAGEFIAPLPPVLYGLPPQYIPEELMSTFIGDLKLVGRNEAVGTGFWWAMRDTVEGEPTYPFKKVVHIGVSAITVSFKAPGKAEITMGLAFYDPSSDADGDGLPDAGVDPIYSVPPVPGVLTRIALPGMPR